MTRLLDLMDRLPDMLYALVVLTSTLGPVAIAGCAIVAIIGAVR